MLKVKELVKILERMPQDARVLTYVKELGGFIRVEKVRLEEGKGFGKDFGKFVVVLEEEKLENLCPECSFFCEERFKDGICK